MVFWAVVSMTVLGLVFALGLVLAARVLSRGENPVIEDILNVLPGVNCGACGHAGCRAYAEAVAGDGQVHLCIPGGQDTATALAALLGVELPEAIRQRAVVHCQGGLSQCGERFQYVGERDCLGAHLTSGGPKACLFGCLGFGTCARACPFAAIAMSKEKLPVIDPEKCTACGICVKACPRNLISLLPAEYEVYLGCSSHYRGKSVKEICSVGCIACGLCAKKDPHEAIVMKDNLPALDFEKAGGDFLAAAEVCPMNSFVVEIETPTPVEMAAAGAGA